MSYPDGHVERFAAARDIIDDASKSPLTHQVSLQQQGKVRMTLEAYESIAATMTNLQQGDVIIEVPARHLQCGDKVWGFSISRWQRLEDGSSEWTFVVPYTVHSMKVVVAEKDLDSVMFPLTDRGDRHSASRRNKALGLPEDLHQNVYKQAEPVASYPVGTRIGDLKHFDRSMHVLFKCPEHEKSAWSSKDPRSSSIFPQSASTEDCAITRKCMVSIYDYVTTHEYLPTRNG